MSEYQYYEFQAIDRRLTDAEQEYIHSLSSRVQLTPTQAVFIYNFGDFRGNPENVLEKCFDAMLYVANWGSKRLMFRFPKSAVNSHALELYCVTNTISLTDSKDHVILDISFPEGDPEGWIEGEGLLSPMVAVRDDLMRGDFRALYLAWLKAVQQENSIDDLPEKSNELEEDEFDDYRDIALTDHEPPVPANLQDLSVPLQNLIDFLEIDQDLLAVAVEASESKVAASEPIEAWIRTLPEEERIRFLIRVAHGESGVGIQLMRRLRELHASPSVHQAAAMTGQRTVAELLKAAQGRAQKHQAEERRQAQLAKERRLNALAEKESTQWQQVTTLIEQKQAKAYDEAVKILVELRELAEFRSTLADFSARIKAIRENYPSLSGLRSRLDQAGLRSDKANERRKKSF